MGRSAASAWVQAERVRRLPCNCAKEIKPQKMLRPFEFTKRHATPALCSLPWCHPPIQAIAKAKSFVWLLSACAFEIPTTLHMISIVERGEGLVVTRLCDRTVTRRLHDHTIDITHRIVAQERWRQQSAL